MNEVEEAAEALARGLLVVVPTDTVYGLASRLQLGGYVKNQTGSVLIEVEGEAPSLDRFLTELAREPPPLALIDHLSWER